MLIDLATIAVLKNYISIDGKKRYINLINLFNDIARKKQVICPYWNFIKYIIEYGTKFKYSNHNVMRIDDKVYLIITDISVFNTIITCENVQKLLQTYNESNLLLYTLLDNLLFNNIHELSFVNTEITEFESNICNSPLISISSNNIIFLSRIYKLVYYGQMNSGLWLSRSMGLDSIPDISSLKEIGCGTVHVISCYSKIYSINNVSFQLLSHAYELKTLAMNWAKVKKLTLTDIVSIFDNVTVNYNSRRPIEILSDFIVYEYIRYTLAVITTNTSSYLNNIKFNSFEYMLKRYSVVPLDEFLTSIYTNIGILSLTTAHKDRLMVYLQKSMNKCKSFISADMYDKCYILVQMIGETMTKMNI
jgi:hypothetical protein